MTRGIRILLTLVMVCCCSGLLKAETAADTICVRILFRQDHSTLDLDYMGNKQVIGRFARQLKRLQENPHVSIQNILIEASASPEGEYRHNRRLAERRAERTRQLLMEHAPGLRLPIKINPKGVDWSQLIRLVEGDRAVPSRNEVLRILRKSQEFDKKPELMTLHGGKPWRYMYEHFFPEMRNGQLLICNFRVRYRDLDSLRMAGTIDPLCRVEIAERADLKELKDLSDLNDPKDLSDPNAKASELHPSMTVPVSPSALANPHSLYYSLSTNLLYDLLLVPNIGVELYDPETRFALAANWWYAWWHNDSWKWYWRYYGGDLAVRWYFGNLAKERPLAGHHIGVYGEYFTYDFELGGKGYIGGIPRGTLWDKGHYACGVEYGYSLPVSERFNIDFVVGVGYSGGEQRQYVPAIGDGYVWERTVKRNFVGPTKVGVNLVWLLNSKNARRSGKGGGR